MIKEEQLKEYLQNLIKKLAILTLKKYQPGIVAVTGSVGKTSVKEAILAVISRHRQARANNKNFNNEIGVPLTILGDYKEIAGKLFWLKVIFMALLRLAIRLKYPEILILEYGVDKPGDMKYLLDIAKPQIGVVTAIGEIPVHVEFFSGPEALAREKSKLIEGLPVTSFAVLNYDDEAVFEMKDRTRAHIMTFGFGEGATMRISNFETRMDGEKPGGIAFKLEYGGSFVPVRLDNCFGKAQAYAAAASACIGIIFGVNLIKIVEALRNYEAPASRGKLMIGVKGTYVMDDSYNASPLSMRAAIETAENIKAKRKIAVLGDMLEIGKYTAEAHEAIGRLIPDKFDILVAVGARAKFIADAAEKGGMAKKSVYCFDTAEEAKLEVQKLMRKGDLILIKASRAIGLDKIVEEIRQV